MTLNIRFLGGANTVTGSKYCVEHGGRKLLVDCGLFQGYKQLRLRNWDACPIPPKDVDAVILTDRKSTRLNSSHTSKSRMPSSA